MKLLGCLLLAYAVALAQDRIEDQTNPFAANPQAVVNGARVYEQTCQSCHGGGGAGDRGPALNGRLARGDRDGEIFQNIRNGINGTPMPSFSQLSTDQTWQLVAYIRSLNGSVAVSSNVSGNLAAGAQIFAGKAGCVGCHSVNGRGGVTGPDLSTSGTNSSEALRQKILTPDTAAPGRGGRRPQIVVARTRDGREIRGVRRNEDTFSLQMVDASGQLHLLDKTTLAAVTVENRSLMPSDYSTRLSQTEVNDVVAYLKTLTVRDLSASAESPGGVPFERLRNSKSEPQNWMMYWGDFQGTHFSPLPQITPANVSTLQAQWSIQLPGEVLQTTPLVVDGVMYSSGAPGQVLALDARTGKQIWRYDRRQKVTSPYESNRSNRGVTLLGNRLFFGTLDAALVALDARTGQFLWETQIADVREGYSITSPPLAVKDKIITGISGGEYGIRGFIDAYDAATGKRVWRFYTVPGPGEPGNETWAGDSWMHGGAATWLTGTYDPETDTVLWPTGNPGPDINGEVRKGDNLYSSSVVALDPNTGKLKWHYQFTPNDTHDWDSTEDMMLVDRGNRKLLIHADRNGFLYMLDRVTGKFITANAFVRQTWNQGFDEIGRPRTVPGWNASADGSIPIFPNLGGGTNFQSPSYDPATGWMYLEFGESGQRFFTTDVQFESGRQYQGGRGVGVDEPSRAGIKALDPENGRTRWEFPLFQGSLSNGVLATGGGVLFAASRDGNLIALNSRTGALLWRFQTGGSMAAAPMSYAVDGRQYIAVASGNVLFSFALPTSAP